MPIRSLTAFVAFALVAANAAGATGEEPAGDQPGIRGVFCIVGGGTARSPAVFTAPHVAGASLLLKWKDIEPGKREYNWSRIDEPLKQLQRAGKKLMLSVSPGIGTPAWAYDAGAKRFHFRSQPRHRSLEPDETDIPVPWDPQFIELWSGFVHALGERYGNDPTVVLVKVAGANWLDPEMNLPHWDRQDVEEWTKAGYTPDHLVETWKRFIDLYASAFPHAVLSLNLALPMGRPSRSVVEEVAEYGVGKYGRRFALQYNSLSDKRSQLSDDQTEGFLYDLVRRSSSRATIGFQTKVANFRGSFADTVGLATNANAHYLELHGKECQDLGNQSLLERFAKH